MAYTMPKGRYQYNPNTGRFEWTNSYDTQNQMSHINWISQYPYLFSDVRKEPWQFDTYENTDFPKNQYVETPDIRLDYNSVRQQPERRKTGWQQASELLGSFSGQDNFDSGSLLGGMKGVDSGGALNNNPSSNIGGNELSGVKSGNSYLTWNNPLGETNQTDTYSKIGETAQSKFNIAGGTSSPYTSGNKVKVGSGMNKDHSAYIEAAKDIAGWSAEIADSSKSKMSLPSQPIYHGENVHDLYGYNQLHKIPDVLSSLATRKPGFLDSFTDINKKTVKGAMDGYNISNNWIGAVVGGIIGTGFGLGNTFARLATHNNDLRRIRRYNDLNQRNYLTAQNNAISNINSAYNTSMYGQRIGNYGAYGGMFPSYDINTYGLGGTVEPQEIMGVTTFNAGGTHEANPNGGVMIGIGENGRPNLVEEGEVRWNDFIFSKRVKPTEDVLRKYNTYIRGDFGSYADMANKILEMHKEREDSPFDKTAMNIQMQRLADAQEWEKMTAEAAENGMSPEEYLEYQQYMESQGVQPMSNDGNLFSLGGPTKGLRSGKGEDGMPYHKTTKVYYKQNNGSKGSLSDHAYVIEHYIDSLMAVPDANQKIYYGKMLDKNGKPVTYTVAQKAELAERAKKALETDENAIYFMYDRIKELKDAFGELMTSDSYSEIVQVNDEMYPIYHQIPLDVGYAINNLGNVNIKYRRSGGEYGTDIKRTDIERQIANFKNNPISLDYDYDTEVTSTNTSSEGPDVQSSNNTYYIPTGSGYSSSNYARTNYSGDDWKPFIEARENNDILNEFTDYYNNKYGKKYSPAKIHGYLSDGKIGPVHKEFSSFLNSKQIPVATAPETKTANNTKSTNNSTNTVRNSIADGIENYIFGIDNGHMNNMGLTPYDSMRLAPVYGSLRSILEQDSPDYTYSDQLASMYRPISYKPIGQYMKYMPIDQHYLDTIANQQRNTLYGFYRNNAMTPSAANYYATLASTQTGSQAEQAYRNSILQNNQNRNNVMQYNNQLDAMNENNRMRTEMANNQNYANIMAQSYAAAEEERLAIEAARESNLQNMYNNIGTIGKELSDRYYVSKNPGLMYGPMGIYYKKPEKK